MSTTRILVLPMAMMILLAAIGCEDPNTGMNDQDQAAASAAARIADLEAQLDQARRDRAMDQDRILALQNEIDRLNADMADQGQAEGWSGVPGGAMISIEGTVLFDSGKAGLRQGAQARLDEVAGAIIDRYPNHEIYIFGHTDDQPIRHSAWKDNYELSCQRALTVLRYLRSRGVNADIAACGWGDTRPEVPNTSASARQANRRVQIYAMEPTGN